MALFELANNALTTLERFKAFYGLSPEDTSKDDALIMLINGASAYIESRMGRKLKRDRYVDKLYPSGRQKQLVEAWPILEVYSTKIGGNEVSPDEYDYKMQGSIGVLFKDDGWPWMAYSGGLAYDPIFASRNLSVDYLAGYVLPKDATPDDPATLPADLEMLLMDMVNTQLKTQSFAGLSAYSMSDISWAFDTTTSEKWESILDRWRRYSV